VYRSIERGNLGGIKIQRFMRRSKKGQKWAQIRAIDCKMGEKICTMVKLYLKSRYKPED